MLKRLKKICVGICLAVAAVPSVFSACSPYYADNIHTLEKLVDDGVIGEGALQNIAALRNGSLQRVWETAQGELETETLPYTPTPVSAELSQDQKSAILKDFNNFIEYRYQTAHADYKVRKSEIVDYFGVYNERTVVEVEFVLSGTEISDEMRDLIISDYYLGQIGGNSLIVCWAEGER